MNILVAGGSGFIGRALVPALKSAGHQVRRLVRQPKSAPEAHLWDPTQQRIDPAALEGVDAVINLAGENLASGRWTDARRERILRSRVDATSTLVRALKAATRKPAVLLSASAVGIYGDRGDEELSETAGIGHGFLPAVCLAWETHAEGAVKLGIRTVVLRFGTVLASDGGALGKMVPVFRLGLGGRLGGGRQWTSWIAREDAIGVIAAALTDDRYSGLLNVVAPNPVTNAEFTTALGRALHRPTILPAPAWALRLFFGQIADEALLSSTRAVPGKLEELGYAFRHPTIESALAAALAGC